MKRGLKIASWLLALFVLVSAVPAMGAPVVIQPAQDESLPNINIKTAALSNNTVNATGVVLTLVFNNSLLDITPGATGKIRIGFSGLSPFNVSAINVDEVSINGNPITISAVDPYQGEYEQYIDIYIDVPIQLTDNVTIKISGLKNPAQPGTYTVAVSTWIAGSMRSSGATTIEIKGPKPPLNIPAPFIIRDHPEDYPYEPFDDYPLECQGDCYAYPYDVNNLTQVETTEDGYPVYSVSYPVNFTIGCDDSPTFKAYAWNLSYQNLTFVGIKIFVDDQFTLYLPVEDFQQYKICQLISDGYVYDEDFTEKNSETTWTLTGTWEHAEPTDMVAYFDQGYGWALTTDPRGFEMENQSYALSPVMDLLDGISADVDKYTGYVHVSFEYASALDPNVTILFQYRTFNGSEWSEWQTIFSFDNTTETAYGGIGFGWGVVNVTQIQFRFLVNFIGPVNLTKPGFAVFNFEVYNDYQTDCDPIYVENPIDGKVTTLYVYDGIIDLTNYGYSWGDFSNIQVEAVYYANDYEERNIDPYQVGAQDFYFNWTPCTTLTLCDIMANARYIVEGGGSWTFGSPQPYYGWEFDADQNPVIATGHGSLAADNLGVLFFLSQAGANPNKVIFDDNPQYVDLTTGQIKGLQDGDIVILVGSSGVNLPLGYYEYVTGEAPVVRIPPQNGMWDAFVLPNGTVVEWAGPDEQWYDVWEDVFVIQWFTTEDGVMVFSIEGAGVDGTVAGSWLVAYLVYQEYQDHDNETLPTSGYIVGRWYEDVTEGDEGYLVNLDIFAPAWIRGSPDDVNGFSTGDDFVKIEYMSHPGLFGLEPGDSMVTEAIPTCWCYYSG